MPKVVPGYAAEARTRIVDTATRLFVTKGYRRTTMDDVAAALGVSKGALYLYFRSKVDILREIQASNRRQARSWMEEALLRANPAVGLADTFDEVFRVAVDREQIGLWFELLGESAHDEEIQKAIRLDAREDRKSLRRFLAELRQRGLLGWEGDLDVLAFTIVSLFQGAVWDISVGIDPARTREQLREAFTRILAPPASAPARRGRS